MWLTGITMHLLCICFTGIQSRHEQTGKPRADYQIVSIAATQQLWSQNCWRGKSKLFTERKRKRLTDEKHKERDRGRKGKEARRTATEMIPNNSFCLLKVS